MLDFLRSTESLDLNLQTLSHKTLYILNKEIFLNFDNNSDCNSLCFHLKSIVKNLKYLLGFP